MKAPITAVWASPISSAKRPGRSTLSSHRYQAAATVKASAVVASRTRFRPLIASA